MTFSLLLHTHPSGALIDKAFSIPDVGRHGMLLVWRTDMPMGSRRFPVAYRLLNDAAICDQHDP